MGRTEIHMENRIFPDHSVIRLYKEDNRKPQAPLRFVLQSCIGTGATCVAYRAEGEDGIPVKLKQFRPEGLSRNGQLYQVEEARFLQAYRQQLAMMKDEKTAAVTSGLYGLYRDEMGFCWTSVSGMVGRTLDSLLPEYSLQKNTETIRRVAESIKAYHDAGWLLLDVKPENILVIDSLGMQGINFFDFDSFVQTSELKTAAEEGRAMLLSSSEAYSAPELMSAEVDLNEIGIRSDFYSVGALLFTALFGRQPELFDCLPDCDYDFSSLADASVTPLSSEMRKTLIAFLHHTLTLSPAGRYETDDSLLQALDEILKHFDLSSPRLVRSCPHAVSSFTGRGRELSALLDAIQASAAPLVVSGMGGIGKTQLVLKAAEMLRDRYDCCFVPFQGSVRQTLLSLPMENLVTEAPDDTGVMQRLPDDEVYRKILSCIRANYKENTLLILDSFDAASDENTPTLQYDPDFAELTALPVRILFTSRCRFDGIRNLPVDELDDESILQLLQAAFPKDPEATLQAIANAAGKHTLTLDIIVRSARESKGKLSAEKVLHSLSSDAGENGSVLENLRQIFKVSSLSRAAKSVMACAQLFPQGGVRSDLLVTALSPGQWMTANQLERSGWLRFDSYSSLWSVHPLVKAICASEKDVRPDWENVGNFVTALQKNQESGYYQAADADGKRQLEEIFANIGRLSLHKPFPWKTLCAAVILIAAVITGFWFSRREADHSPVLTLTLFPAEDASEEEIAHDSEILRMRLRNLGIKDVSIDTGSGTVTAHTHTSVFGQTENLSDTIRLTINRAGNLNVVGEMGYQFFSNLISRDLIRSAEAHYGSLPQVGTAERLKAGLSPSGDYPYLHLVLDEGAKAAVDEAREFGDTLTFRFDVETLKDRSLMIALVLPGQEEGSYYLLDGRWKSLSVWNALAFSLIHDPLCSAYTFSTEMDPSANWQDPDSLTSDTRGSNQLSIDLLTGDTVTLFYSSPSPEEISDFNYDLALLAFKRKLDRLGLPYAIGTDYFDRRRIAVCLPTEHLCYDTVASILPATGISLSSAYNHGEQYFPSSSDYQAEVRQCEDGRYTLVLSAADSYRERIQACTEAMLTEGDNLIELTCRSSIKIAEMKIESPIDDGVLIFDRLPFLGVNHITEEQLPILEMLCEIINSDGYRMNGGYYSLDDYAFSSPDGSFGIAGNIAEGAALIENISRDFPPATARRDPTGGSDIIYIFMQEETGPGFADRAAERIESIYRAYDIENSNVDTYLFILTDEGDDGLCRIVMGKSSSLSHSEYRYYVQAVLRSDEFLQYRDEIEQAFSSREFYADRAFSFW